MIPGGVPEIHLDTSFFIRSLVPGFEKGKVLRGWLRSGRSVAISTLVWGEFLCGPLDNDLEPIARRVTRQHVSLATSDVAEFGRFAVEGLQLVE